MTSGVYNLIIHLPETTEINVGKLGKFTFPQGYYIYTGSALSGLKARINRHMKQEKKLHWHIDYMLQHGKIIDVVTYETKERLECKLNRQILSLPDSKIIAEGFGSSDCNCISHLVYFSEKNDIYIPQERLLGKGISGKRLVDSCIQSYPDYTPYTSYGQIAQSQA